MVRLTHRLLLAAALAALVTPSVSAQQRVRGGSGAGADLSDSALVATLDFRSIGPAVMSGRIIDIAVASSHGERGGALGDVFYVGAASGGVWKTTNGGMSWEHVFDTSAPGSIGAVEVSASNSRVVWVGTGEDNNQRSSSYGDGVYKSIDGGKTWAHMGLRESQQVGRIRVHPTDPDVVLVAAAGPMWAAGGERGVYKTTDGGETWRNVLSVDQYTGAADVIYDPSNPDVVYAAMHQRERRAFNYVGGGPGSGIWKSEDGGETWFELTNGLPTSDMGRIGLDVSRSHPSTVYAVIEGSEQGVYRTDDAGATWRKMSDIASIPWYFGEVRVDPNDPDRVYHLGVSLQVSEDGGVTWERTGRGPHSDHHSLWISPENSKLVINGNDGGLYVSRDGALTWDFSVNLPVSQFYALGLDMAEPFYGIAGGLQDNSTWGGPSRTRASGIFNADWYRMAGGDGFYAAIDPTDPDIAYVESQGGVLLRYDRRTGDRKGIQPRAPEGEDGYRFNWSAPIHISPWDHNTIYFAANYMFKSTNRGDEWTVLGEDLTRSIPWDSLEMMGEIQERSAVAYHQGVVDFGTISDIDVSEVQRGLLIAGTDDGVVAVSTDDGQSWNKQMRFPGVPDTAYVSKVRLSQHDASVMYVTFDNHRSNDFHPYVIRSDDGGQSWTNITNDLPDFGNVRSFAEHHANPDLLFVGTEMGVFVSTDRGGGWTRLWGGMPTVRVDDMAIHPRDNALVVATHGLGFWILDDLAPLEHLAEAKAAPSAFLVPVKSEWLIERDASPSSGTHATRDYAGENPPTGTTISYMLKSPARGMKLEITTPSGEVVRTLDAPSSAGLHHVLWDFRMDAPYSGPPEERQQNQGLRGFGGFGGGNQGAPVVPGTYVARLTAGGSTQERTFAVKKDPELRLTDAQLVELRNARMRQLRLNATLTMAIRQTDEVRQQLTDAKAALDEVDAPESLTEMVESIETELNDIRSTLGAGGGGFFGGGNQSGPRSVRVLLAYASGVSRANAMPTAQEMEALETGAARLTPQVERLNALVAERIPALIQAMDAAGVPWTPGRVIG